MPCAVFHSPGEWRARYGPARGATTLTIGNFDGVHIGHQKILRGVVEHARATSTVAAAVTFDPLPLKVLRPADAPPQICTLPQRLAQLDRAGLDAVLVLRFDLELSRYSPQDFIRILLDQLSMRAILVGENFRFGHRQLGDVALLSRLGRQHGFHVGVVPPVFCRREVVSSTAIRTHIRAGRVARAARLLGRPFVLTGHVRPGTGTGARLVFPTLNLAPEQELLPAMGVYATETRLGSRTYRSATNVGVRPTFNGQTLAVESHLFEFSEMVTAGPMEVHFWQRLRDERKFPSPDALRSQISLDLTRARRFFSRVRGSSPHVKAMAQMGKLAPRDSPTS